jgi:hypothetical protein
MGTAAGTLRQAQDRRPGHRPQSATGPVRRRPPTAADVEPLRGDTAGAIGGSAGSQSGPQPSAHIIVAGKGAFKSLTSATAGRRFAAIAQSQLPLVVAYRSAGMQLTLIMSRWARYRYFSSGAASPFEWGSVAMPGWGRSFRAYTVKGLVTELEPGLFLTESGELVETSVLPKSATVLTAEAFTPVNITRFIAGGMFAFALSGGVQLWFDYPNPYLSGEQIRRRAEIAGLGGLGVWGVGLSTTAILGWAGAGAWAGPIGIGAGFVAGFIWFGFFQPVIFEGRGLNPERKLSPLH